MQVPYFSPGDVGEEPTLSFNFVNDLAAGETIASVVFTLSVAAVSSLTIDGVTYVNTGTDSTPSSRMNGAAVVNGLVVSQQLIGCVGNVIYMVLALVTTSLGNKYSDWNYYPVVTPA